MRCPVGDKLSREKNTYMRDEWVSVRGEPLKDGEMLSVERGRLGNSTTVDLNVAIDEDLSDNQSAYQMGLDSLVEKLKI